MHHTQFQFTGVSQQYEYPVTNLFTLLSFFFCLCLPAVVRLLESSQRQHIQQPISVTSDILYGRMDNKSHRNLSRFVINALTDCSWVSRHGSGL